jgi:hypothetical protein
MARSKNASQGQRRGKAGLPVGVVGLSLSLAGAACAESAPANAASATPQANVRTLNLHEVEVSDVSLGSFRVFDREAPQDAKPEAVAWWRGCRGCGGCRGCRGRRGCRGCGG